jgi:hypothetical protein
MLETRNENTIAIVKPELERPEIYRDVIKLHVKKSDLGASTGLIWLRAETTGRLL